jgi:CubicO group peptidase (beta-lactamase class C family)
MVYSSIAMDVRGLLIERVAGAPRDVVMRRALLDPLGMTDTAWSGAEAKRASIAGAPDGDPAKAEMWQSYRILENSSGRAYFEGGAGLVSAASNSRRFAQMIADGGVLDGQRYLAPALGARRAVEPDPRHGRLDGGDHRARLRARLERAARPRHGHHAGKPRRCDMGRRLAACRNWGRGAHMMPATHYGAVQSFTMRSPPTPLRRSLRNDTANPTGC